MTDRKIAASLQWYGGKYRKLVGVNGRFYTSDPEIIAHFEARIAAGDGGVKRTGPR